MGRLPSGAGAGASVGLASVTEGGGGPPPPIWLSVGLLCACADETDLLDSLCDASSASLSSLLDSLCLLLLERLRCEPDTETSSCESPRFLLLRCLLLLWPLLLLLRLECPPCL